MTENKNPSVKPARHMLGGFIALFCVGVAILTFAELQYAKTQGEVQLHDQRSTSDWRVIGIPLLQHLASALIVASIMGVSYEYFVHRHVVEDFGELLGNHRKITEKAFDAFRATTARDVFEFIGDVASQGSKVPTLFRPPRDAVNEILFSRDLEFFRRLIGSENARLEAVEVLGSWLESAEVSKRFLASDFVGLLLLGELEPKLRELATEHQKNWKDLSETERGCVLNYWWAVSRLETPMYERLKEVLVRTEDPFVRKWILFLPRQMPDAQLAHVLEVFLRTRGEDVQRDVLSAAIVAIEALHQSGIDMKRAVTRYKAVFDKASLWQEVNAAVSVALPPQSVRPRRGRVLRTFRLLRKGLAQK